MDRHSLTIHRDSELDLYNIHDGVLAPLDGFMDSKNYKSVVEVMHLLNGDAWTIPITLDISETELRKVSGNELINLKNSNGQVIGEMNVEDVYRTNLENDVPKIFGTRDMKHPGVAKEVARSPYRVGGKIRVISGERALKLPYTLKPIETRQIFKELGWKTVAGFQTRNPIHRAHEYLQSLAMEVVDGIFLHPLIGWKKCGDVMPEALIASYEYMIENIYPKSKVVLGTLTTPMRYAGPREAVFHAIIRRNHGCTHFIVGRDHAGIGNYYGKYEARDFCKGFSNLGIKILDFCGPYYCHACGSIVTERTCPHSDRHAIDVSGTEIRFHLGKGERPPEEYMRSEIADILIKMGKEGRLFVESE